MRYGLDSGLGPSPYEHYEINFWGIAAIRVNCTEQIIIQFDVDGIQSSDLKITYARDNSE